MDPFLFALLLSGGVAIGWGSARWLGRPPSQRPLFLVLGGIGALLGGAMAPLVSDFRLNAAGILGIGAAAAIVILAIFGLGKARLAG
jgi:hypothetical protein